ncbi:hypothetical protein DFQ27_002822 [Actinomortierella ambigua]|uniref:Uncharacterized protein n=1 Tax=Actinomortierella ambigua TaxID=1343610 RepID=A0A9P6Q6K2_9FUNG|nr:hypothetical protein DFQ27_002822 [Actinomortierella ambigua]
MTSRHSSPGNNSTPSPTPARRRQPGTRLDSGAGGKNPVAASSLSLLRALFMHALSYWVFRVRRPRPYSNKSSPQAAPPHMATSTDSYSGSPTRVRQTWRKWFSGFGTLTPTSTKPMHSHRHFHINTLSSSTYYSSLSGTTHSNLFSSNNTNTNTNRTHDIYTSTVQPYVDLYSQADTDCSIKKRRKEPDDENSANIGIKQAKTTNSGTGPSQTPGKKKPDKPKFNKPTVPKNCSFVREETAPGASANLTRPDGEQPVQQADSTAPTSEPSAGEIVLAKDHSLLLSIENSHATSVGSDFSTPLASDEMEVDARDLDVKTPMSDGLAADLSSIVDSTIGQYVQELGSYHHKSETESAFEQEVWGAEEMEAIEALEAMELPDSTASQSIGQGSKRQFDKAMSLSEDVDGRKAKRRQQHTPIKRARAQQYDFNAQQQQDWLYVWTQWRKDWDTWQLLLQEKKPVATDDAQQMQIQAFAEYVQNLRFHIPQIISANACFLNSAVVGEMDLMKDLTETATRELGLEDDLETLDAEKQERRRWLERSITDLNNFSSNASTKQYQREPGPGNVSGVLNRGARAGSE